MKKLLIFKIACIFCMAGILAGCEDFLEVEVPKDQIDKNKVFNDEELATAALTQIYSLMRFNGFLSGNTSGCGILLGCYTDELEATVSHAAAFKNFYEGTVLPNNEDVKLLWNSSYKQIYMANTMIEGLEEASQLNKEKRNQLLGEALAIRGLLHFYLSQTFGDVPYIKTTDYTINKQVHKDSHDKVMNLVVEDFLRAESLLNVQYPSQERVRINQAVVQSLLARVYLYMHDWVAAQYYAQTVINYNMYDLEDLDRVFLRDSRSAIWQFKPEYEGKSPLEGDAYIFESLPAPKVKMNPLFLQQFEPDDLRKVSWLKFVGSDSLNCHVFKYKSNGGSKSMISSEYSVIIRIEEMYLIAAEAAAELQDWLVFNNMLNKIRNRAGLPDLSIANTEMAITALLKERKVELFCEYGHNFYDLKRRGRLNELKEVKPNWQPYFELLPLPEAELVLNPKLLPQNNGY